MEDSAGCSDEKVDIWPKSHFYSPVPCQPETLSLHSTANALWETGNNHSRQRGRSQDSRSELCQETVHHSASQGHLEPSNRCGTVPVLQEYLLLAAPGTKATSTCDENPPKLRTRV